MTDAPSPAMAQPVAPAGTARPDALAWLVWALLFLGLPAAIAMWEGHRQQGTGAGRPAAHGLAAGMGRARGPRIPPPPVEPVKLYALDRDAARAFNAAIPLSRAPNPAARPFLMTGSPDDFARATDCLAAAELFEAGDDPTGQRAVAQVVLNRVRHPAFPKSVCGVVFQGQERRTGCQFTFTCDGALTRTPSPAAWDRTRETARAALTGMVFPAVGHATHYHTDWVVPYWSGSLDKVTAIGTHLFFRWKGWWGTPPAFGRGTAGGEPSIARIARFSPVHAAGGIGLAMTTQPDGAPPIPETAEALAERTRQAIGMDLIGKTVAGVRLISITGPGSFLVELPKGSTPDSWPVTARTYCAGRPQCRIMGWAGGDAPTQMPLTLTQMAAMRFSYIHDTRTGLQKALWNCAQTPRTNRAQCMRQRVPVAVPLPGGDAGAPPGLAGVRRRPRFETVTITPPGARPAPAPAPGAAATPSPAPAPAPAARPDAAAGS